MSDPVDIGWLGNIKFNGTRIFRPNKASAGDVCFGVFLFGVDR